MNNHYQQQLQQFRSKSLPTVGSSTSGSGLKPDTTNRIRERRKTCFSRELSRLMAPVTRASSPVSRRTSTTSSCSSCALSISSHHDESSSSSSMMLGDSTLCHVTTNTPKKNTQWKFQSVPSTVQTDKETLERVLGEIVDVVIDVSSRDRGEEKQEEEAPFDLSGFMTQLTYLRPAGRRRSSNSTTPASTTTTAKYQQTQQQREDSMILRLSGEQLEVVLARVVASAEDSVRNGTKRPTGMHLANMGGDLRNSTSLRWGKKNKRRSASSSFKTTKAKPTGSK